ncbi:cupredoxin domain-containing protein [Flavobacterium sp. W22_SRS_FP1]|uniref:cupredoxin domain-containing protein n=1 Tax=Flavobacterium sp. W22_SRS_FP1 TaxID=3240276 RepID=UPI003F8F41FE
MFVTPFIFSSCSKDDVPTVTVVNSKVYDLGTVGTAGVSGRATFIENSDATVSIELELLNTPQGGSHTAHIHLNNAADGGDIALTLKPVDGTTGKSITTFKALDNGSAITYQALLDFDGYINVHLSGDKLATLLAQGNIGSNVGGTEAKTYSVTANGTSSYVFNGEGLTNSNNPNFTFKRGGTYTFNMSAAGHPFYINTIQGTGTANAYNSGVTRNGAVTGTITFTVPMNAPNTLYYNCQFHASMNGTITITN